MHACDSRHSRRCAPSACASAPRVACVPRPTNFAYRLVLRRLLAFMAPKKRSLAQLAAAARGTWTKRQGRAAGHDPVNGEFLLHAPCSSLPRLRIAIIRAAHIPLLPSRPSLPPYPAAGPSHGRAVAQETRDDERVRQQRGQPQQNGAAADLI